MKNTKWIGWVAGILVLGAVIAAFAVVGSPAHQRALRFDRERINDLSQIQYEIRNYWNLNDKLPAQLSDLTSDVSGFTVPTDPQSGDSYEYRVKGDLNFELCASFNLESRNDERDSYSYAYQPSNWQHGPGHVCFDRTINPELDRVSPPDKPLPQIAP